MEESRHWGPVRTQGCGSKKFDYTEIDTYRRTSYLNKTSLANPTVGILENPKSAHHTNETTHTIPVSANCLVASNRCFHAPAFAASMTLEHTKIRFLSDIEKTQNHLSCQCGGNPPLSRSTALPLSQGAYFPFEITAADALPSLRRR